MLRLLYKLLHFEGRPDHVENVKTSFVLIWLFIATFIYVLMSMFYVKIFERSIELKSPIFLTEVMVCAFLYYWIAVRYPIIFLRKGWDREYYNFGKYSDYIKPLFFLLMMALLVFLAIQLRVLIGV